MSETTFKGVQLSPTQRFNLSYTLEEYVKMQEKDDYWWKFVGYYSYPFRWFDGLYNQLENCANKLQGKIGELTSFQIILGEYQITKKPVNVTSGGGQYYVNPNCYALNLRGAVWEIAESIVNSKIQSTISPEEYLKLYEEAFDSFENVVIKEIKE